MQLLNNQIIHYLLPVVVIVIFAQSPRAQWTQVGTDIDGVQAGQQFGDVLAISSGGSHMIVGARSTNSATGEVRIYKLNSGDWVQIGAFVGDGNNSHFGAAVAISADGSRVAIGSPFHGPTNAGLVRIFEFNQVWGQVGSDIIGLQADDMLGVSLAMSADGRRIAVGARDVNDTGEVRIYDEVPAGSWTLVHTPISGVSAGERFGQSVALSTDGSRLAIGAPFSATNTGHVKVYTDVNNAWVQVGSDITGISVQDYFGWSVSLSANGMQLVVGAIETISGVNAGPGYARMFWDSSGIWQPVWSVDGEATGDQCGSQVALSADGTVLAVGGHTNSGNGFRAGHVRIFRNTLDTWTQVGDDLEGVAAEDRFGWSLSISDHGRRVAAGAIYHNAQTGHVRVFDAPCDLVIDTNLVGKLNDVLWCMESGDTITFDPLVFGDTLPLREPLTIDLTDFAMIADPSWNITIDASNFPRALITSPEASGIIEGVKILSGEGAMAGRGFHNNGDFILSDVIFEDIPTAPDGTVLLNAGELTIKGSLLLKQ